MLLLPHSSIVAMFQMRRNHILVSDLVATPYPATVLFVDLLLEYMIYR